MKNKEEVFIDIVIIVTGWASIICLISAVIFGVCAIWGDHEFWLKMIFSDLAILVGFLFLGKMFIKIKHAYDE